MQLGHQVFIKISALSAIKQARNRRVLNRNLTMQWKKIRDALYPEVEKIITICSYKKCI